MVESVAAAPMAKQEPLWKLIPLWLIVALLVSSPMIGAAVINAEMAVSLKMNAGQVGAGFSLMAALMSLTGPLVALAFGYFGIRNVALAGTLLATLGAVCLGSVVSSPVGFVLSFGLLMGIGIGACGIIPVQTVVSTWYPHRRALATSVVFSALNFSGIIAAPALAWLIRSTGTWRSGWWVTTGCFTIAGVLILGIFPKQLCFDSHGPGPPPHSESHPNKSHVYKTYDSWPVGEALRSHHFLLLLVYSLATAVVWVFFLAHGVEHLREIGYSPAVAAAAVSIVVGAQLCGTFAAGFLGDRISPHLISVCSMLLIGVGLALDVSPSGLPALVVFAVVFGVAFGASQVSWVTELANYFGMKPFPMLFGITHAVGALGAVIGGVGAGSVYDRLHTFRPVFMGGIAMLAVVALFKLFSASQHPLRRKSVEINTG